MGVPEGVAQKNFGRQNCVCSSTTLHKNQISMFLGLGEEERTRFKKKNRIEKRKQKRKTSSRPKVDWLGSVLYAICIFQTSLLSSGVHNCVFAYYKF